MTNFVSFFYFEYYIWMDMELFSADSQYTSAHSKHLSFPGYILILESIPLNR